MANVLCLYFSQNVQFLQVYYKMYCLSKYIGLRTVDMWNVYLQVELKMISYILGRRISMFCLEQTVCVQEVYYQKRIQVKLPSPINPSEKQVEKSFLQTYCVHFYELWYSPDASYSHPLHESNLYLNWRP